MENSDLKEPSNQPDKEPSFEKIQALLDESYSWVTKILREYAGEDDQAIATLSITTRDDANNELYGSITVRKSNGNVYIKLNESNYSDITTEDNTTERYVLTFDYHSGEYMLRATGKQPDIMEDAILSDDSEDALSLAIDTSESYFESQLRLASTTEIQRLTDLLELAAHGNMPFDFDHFEIEYEQHLDELYMEQLRKDEENENRSE